MGRKLIISEEEKQKILFLYEQRTEADIDYSFIEGKSFNFFADKKEGKQKPIFVGQIIKIEPEISGVATGVSHALPGKAYHEYKIYQFLTVKITSSEDINFQTDKEYRFLYYCEYRSLKLTQGTNKTGFGKYYESFELTKLLNPICSNSELKTSGIIKYP